MSSFTLPLRTPKMSAQASQAQFQRRDSKVTDNNAELETLDLLPPEETPEQRTRRLSERRKAELDVELERSQKTLDRLKSRRKIAQAQYAKACDEEDAAKAKVEATRHLREQENLSERRLKMAERARKREAAIERRKDEERKGMRKPEAPRLEHPMTGSKVLDRIQRRMNGRKRYNNMQTKMSRID